MEHQHRLSDNRSTTRWSIATLWLALLICSSSSTLAQTPVPRSAIGIGGSGLGSSHAIAVDAGGNSYITGYFQDTVDFDPGPGTANLTVVGQSGYLAKYDTAGKYLWAFPIGLSGQSLAFDRQGNVVVRGRLSGTADFDPGTETANLTAGTNQMFLAMYTPTGKYLWAFHLPIQSYGQKMAIDSSGNIVVCGSFRGTVDFDPGSDTVTLEAALSTQDSPDMFVVKYSATGSFIRAFSVGGSDFETGNAVAIDGDDNIYVTGYFGGTVNFNPGSGAKAIVTSSGGSDMFLAKYDKNGKYRWAFAVGDNVPDQGLALAIDGSSNVVVTGMFGGTADFDPGFDTANLTSVSTQDIFVANYDSLGNFLWAFGPGRGWGTSVAIDGSGNILVGGNFTGTADFDPGAGTTDLSSLLDSTGNGFVARYTSSGDLRWAFGVSSNYSHVAGLAIGSSGDIYVTGGFNGTADFDPSQGTANLTSADKGAGFIARYSEAKQPNLSVGENQRNSHDIVLRAAPNPFTSEFTLRYDGALAPSRIQIVDMMGQVVATREIAASNGEIHLGSELQAGTYLVQIIQGEERRMKLIQKVK